MHHYLFQKNNKTDTAVYEGSEGLGYVQGMSDLASPFVVITDADEVDAFWCFANFMEDLKLVRIDIIYKSYFPKKAIKPDQLMTEK